MASVNKTGSAAAKAPGDWDDTCDLVVVGAGGAGMMAAAEAAKAGLKVVLLEKCEQVGGTTGMSVGSIMAAGTPHQQAEGIADTPQAHARDMDVVRHSFGLTDNEELRRIMTENVAEAVRVLGSIGINFLGPLPQPPHTVSRLIQVMPTSRAYVFHLEKHCRALGVDIRVGCRATRLLREGQRVNGIEAVCNGQLVRFHARSGVILCSGDISGNANLLHEHMKNWVDGIEVYNPNNTGDGQLMGAEIGASIASRKDLGPEASAFIRFVRPARRTLMQRIPPFRVVTSAMVAAMKLLPPWLIRPFAMGFLTTALGPDHAVYKEGAILVNRRGERFTDELGAANLDIPRQPGGEAYIVFDQAFARKFSAWPYFISTAPGVAFAFVDDYRRARPDIFHTADTPQQLANRIGADPAALQRSVDAVNLSRTDKRLEEGPFYALGPVKVWVLVAPVGLSINSQFQVLDRSGAPIDGLYAAGNAGIGGYTITQHGHALGWAFTSGMLSARSAVALTPGH